MKRIARVAFTAALLPALVVLCLLVLARDLLHKGKGPKGGMPIGPL